MKIFKYILLILVLPLLSNCGNNDDDGIDCALFDPAQQQFFIELVDEQGNNLFENETFNREEILIQFNGLEFPGVFTDFEPLENFIVLEFFGEQGDNTYQIVLSENETDTLILNLSIDSQICGIRFFNLNTATYNEQEQNIILDNDIVFGPLIRVVR